MNASQITTAKMPALVAFYNEQVPSKPVKKFADIATARKRCLALLPKEDQKVAKAPKVKAEKAPKEPKAPADRSAAIAASWLVPEVASARVERTAVRVAGQDFASVKKAFVALGLSLSRHIRFRMALKEAGKATFEQDGKKYNFAVVDAK